jgi:hypothetical protein
MKFFASRERHPATGLALDADSRDSEYRSLQLGNHGKNPIHFSVLIDDSLRLFFRHLNQRIFQFANGSINF